MRADVQALGVAMDTGNETSLLLLTLGKDIGRLPSRGYPDDAATSRRRDSRRARAERNRRRERGSLVNTMWVVVGLGVAGALVALVTAWHRRDQPPDLGAVSYQWVAEQRLGQGNDSQR